uniref:non-specific lipid-transfer protein Lac s 1-like n=1 Tax=Erigeron canadensis TaxID=72917 RepID=UPI001CB8F6F5|nr:non-specific lipid-transfer protein Lac s 1-like [Erigeron canadensis]
MAGMLMKIACMVVACMVVLAPYGEAIITCGQVTSNLLPCLNYLRNGGQVPTNCCAGVRSVKRAARTRPDRQNACKCIKSACKDYPGIIEANAAILPKKCSVKIPYHIQYSIDCSKIQ